MNLLSVFCRLAAPAFLALLCYTCATAPASRRHNSDPSLFILADARLNTSLQCTRNGNNWVVSGGAAEHYLALVADDFKQQRQGGIREVLVEFSPDYTKGTLTGIATDLHGARLPLGAVFAFKGRSGDTLTMAAPIRHRCVGVRCSCCVFVKDADGTIRGCRCDPADGCAAEGDTSRYCSHGISN